MIHDTGVVNRAYSEDLKHRMVKKAWEQAIAAFAETDEDRAEMLLFDAQGALRCAFDASRALVRDAEGR